jgi:carboxypeptidase C (cathepsin A)
LLAKEPIYDPQAAAITSAYVSTFNDYVRRDLKFGQGKTFKPNNYAGIDESWDWHKPPGASDKLSISTNVMPDLAYAMKSNPNLKVQLTVVIRLAGCSPRIRTRHLPVPPTWQNLEFRRYQSGHMVYLHEASRHALRQRCGFHSAHTTN